MGISDEAIKARDFIAQNAPQFAVGANADDIRSRLTATTDALQDDIERIEVEGREAIASGPLTDSERRNLEARLAGEEFDAIRQAELAGTRSGRIEITGAGANEKKRVETAARRKVEQESRTQALLALQAQLDGLRQEYEAADKDVQDILAHHLSREEQDYLADIEDESFRAQEEMRLMREKLAQGGITQSEFDKFEDFWAVREAKALEIKNLENIMEHGSDAEIQAAAQSEDIDVVRDSRHAGSAETQTDVEAILNGRDSDGRENEQHTAEQESVFLAKTVALDGGLPSTSILDGGSVASQVMPDELPSPDLPDVKGEFEAAGMLVPEGDAPSSDYAPSDDREQTALAAHTPNNGMG